MSIVTNTSPLIILAKIDKLDLLQKIFKSIAIPPAVYRELMAKSGVEANRLDKALDQFVEVTSEPIMSSSILAITQHLDAGEQQAIALAYSQQSKLVIDERLGRQAARQLGIVVTGSIGVLIEGKQRGYIDEVMPLLQQLRQHDYWLSDRLIAAAAKLADEI